METSLRRNPNSHIHRHNNNLHPRPKLQSIVDFLADQAVGEGFYTTINEQYAKVKQTKQTIDNFNEAVNLDELLQIAAREIVVSGNGFM